MAETRKIPVELTIENKDAFIRELDEIAKKAQDILKLNLQIQNTGGIPVGSPSSGGSRVSAPSMPTPPSQQASPSYLGQSTPNMPPQSAQSLAHTHAQTVSRMPNGGSLPPSSAHYMNIAPEVTKLMSQITPYIKNVASLNTDLHGTERKIYDDMRRLSGRLLTIAENAHAGMNYNPLRADNTIKKLEPLLAEFQAGTRGYLAMTPVAELQKAAEGLVGNINSHKALPLDQQDPKQIRDWTEALNQIGGRLKTIENRSRAEADVTYAIKSYSNRPDVPSNTNWLGMMQKGQSLAGQLLPMYSGLLGLHAIGYGYNTTANLAPMAGQIAMNVGGVSPNSVFSQLNTMGRVQGFSATQMAETIQAQGSFTGNGNMAFLFKDSMQTAQFARALGIGTNTAAQIMGSYQLSGAFGAGNESGTAQMLAAAAQASGMNTSAFMQGVAQLAQSGMRTGVQTGGGSATSLAMLNRLGTSMGINLFQGPNAVTTLEQMQQGFSAGPGAQSGLYAAQMIPLYQSVQKAMAPTYNAMGITNPFLQMGSILNTNMSDYPTQMLKPWLSTMHNQLIHSSGAQQQMLEYAYASTLFGGNTSAQALQATSQLATTHGFNLSTTAQAIKNAQGTLSNNSQTYAQSISGHVQTINANVQAIANKIGATTAKAGAPLGEFLGSAPGVSGALGVAIPGAAVIYGLAKKFGIGGVGSSAESAGGGFMSKLFGSGASTTASGFDNVMGGTSKGLGTLKFLRFLSPLSDAQIGSSLSNQAYSPIYNQMGFHTTSSNIFGHTMVNNQTGMVAHSFLGFTWYTQEASKNAKTSNDWLQKIDHTLENIYGKQAQTSFGNPSLTASGWLGQASLNSQILGQTPGGTGTSFIGPQLKPSSGYVGAGQQNFVTSMKPYALQTAAKMGVPAKYQNNVAQFLLSEWGLESAWGSSTAASQNDNFGGIKPPGSGHFAGADNKYAGYSSLSDWANGDAYFFTHNSNYAKFVQAAKSGASPTALAAILGGTSYASNPNYGSEIAQTLPSVLSAYNKSRPSQRHNVNRKVRATAG